MMPRLTTNTLIRLAMVPVCLQLLAGSRADALDVRIKDITTIEGMDVTRLTGIGLVTGLNGTGGKSPVTRQLALNLLQKYGLRADAATRLNIANDANSKTDNLSVVTVTAEIRPFAKRGSRVDVTVSAFDDASSLQGGTLLLTPLFGVDDEVYVIASGQISVGGFSFGGDAASVQKNHPTVGRVANGGSMVEEIETVVAEDGRFRLLLTEADLETANRITAAVKKGTTASAVIIDAGTIEVIVNPRDRINIHTAIASMQQLTIEPDVKARVVINERTGTVVIGKNVKLSQVAITHANLSVINSETPEVSQPNPFGGGDTTVVPRTQIEVNEDKAFVSVLNQPATVGDLAAALNALGVTPRDLSSIFQQLKEAGALHADLEFR